MRLLRACLLLAAAVAAARLPPSLSLARGSSAAGDCKAGVCGGMADYAVAPGMRFFSTFNVPGLPLNKTAIEADVTFFIYANVFFDGGPGQCKDCRMNQFVSQLMLGNPLYASTGPPGFDPQWAFAPTWIFATQYFMEIYTNGTAKAAAGQWFNCTEKDVLWTEYALDEAAGGAWVWTLRMGVVGDAARTSTLVVDQPFMGLLAPETRAWTEPAYAVAHWNSCLELYGVAPYGGTHYPASAIVYDLRTTLGAGQAPVPWQTAWTDVEFATCPGHPNSTFAEIHNATQQDVIQNVFFQAE